MKQRINDRAPSTNGRRPARVLASGLSLLLLAGSWFGCATGAPNPSTVPEPPGIEETWGIEVTSLRLTANGHMLDYRYRVLDADKAALLFKRQVKPYLIHQPSEKVMAVPETAKLGPLRNSNIPQEGKIYWMFFGNAGEIVKHGDRVTVVIGDFRVEDMIVE
jgi:hypothetical protein